MKIITQSLVKCVSASVICSFGIMTYGTENPKPPNVLLFLADDMTWEDCEPYGNSDVITPNMHRLASEGMSFDNMHINVKETNLPGS
jgi:hypothetical protein